MSSSTDPFTLFARWFNEAVRCKAIKEPTAMCLATATPKGAPAARMVLLKGYDERGFAFYTNVRSRKGKEIAKNPQAALCFYWMALDKQVRIEGRLQPVSDAEADAYFASRAKGSQIGAWASQQSQGLASKKDLLNRVAKYTAKYGLSEVPRPPHWSGFILKPKRFEFWQQGEFRIHDRTEFRRGKNGWKRQLLYP